MPTSVFQIDVNSAAFDKFKKSFENYQKVLSKIPAAWNSANQAAGGMGKTVRDMTAALLAQQEAYKNIDKAQQKVAANAGAQERSLQRTATLTSRIAKSMKEATGSILKWGTLTTVGGGLLGVGGLWGLDRLASGNSNLRRTAQGFGLSTGQMQAFGLNYSKFVDTNSVLSNISNAKNDPSKWYTFQSMGQNNFQNMNPAELAVRMMPEAKRIFEEGHGNAQYAEARGLLNVYTMEDLRRLHEMSQQEITDAQRKYEADQKTLAVSDDTRRVWQDLSIRFERSGTTILNVLTKALKPLAPELDKLSGAATKLVGDLLSTETLKKWITAAADGLHWLGEYLTSDKLKQDITWFGNGIMQIASALEKVAKRINRWFGDDEATPAGAAPNTMALRDRSGSPVLADMNGPSSPYHLGSYGSPMDAKGYTSASATARRMGRWMGFKQQGIDQWGRGVGDEGYDPVGAAEMQWKLPANLLHSIRWAESSDNPNIPNSSAGALGDFQFMRDTARQYGLSDADTRDTNKSAPAAGHYMSDLLAHYNNNLTRAVAAYNYGQGNVDRKISLYGDNWRNYIPKETSDYLRKVLGPGAQSGVEININNNTGGNAVVTTNQTAHQQ